MRNEPEFQVPQKEWLAAEAHYKNQQAIVSQKQADLSAKWLAYQTTQDSVVTASVDGTVENLSANRDQVVSAYSQLNVSEPILVLVTHSTLMVKVNINETDYPKLAVGQRALVSVDALGNGTFEGKVLRFDTVGTNTQGVITYDVYIELDENHEGVFPGMTATVDIEVARKDDALTLPASAVKPYQGGKAVRVVGKNNEIEYVPVEIGVHGSKSVEIVSGIDETTPVITALKNEQIERSGGGLFGSR